MDMTLYGAAFVTAFERSVGNNLLGTSYGSKYVIKLHYDLTSIRILTSSTFVFHSGDSPR